MKTEHEFKNSEANLLLFERLAGLCGLETRRPYPGVTVVQCSAAHFALLQSLLIRAATLRYELSAQPLAPSPLGLPPRDGTVATIGPPPRPDLDSYDDIHSG